MKGSVVEQMIEWELANPCSRAKWLSIRRWCGGSVSKLTGCVNHLLSLYAFFHRRQACIIRPHRGTMYVDGACCYGRSSVVCLSVCHDREPCKNGWTDRDAVWVVDSGGPNEPCIRWGPDPPMRRGNFEGAAVVKLQVYGIPSVCAAALRRVVKLLWPTCCVFHWCVFDKFAPCCEYLVVISCRKKVNWTHFSSHRPDTVWDHLHKVAPVTRSNIVIVCVCVCVCVCVLHIRIVELNCASTLYCRSTFYLVEPFKQRERGKQRQWRIQGVGCVLFFHRLISAATDWMSTILLHMAWPRCEFRMQVWNVLHTARCKYRTQKSRQKSPSGHHRTTLSG